MSDAARDRIELRGLRVRGHHGVLPEERRDGQEFVVDVLLEVDTRRAAETDDLTDTVDYADLAARLAAVIAGEPVALIETLAARLAAVALHSDDVAAVEVTVHKPQAPVGQPVDVVVVHIRRDRRGRRSCPWGPISVTVRRICARV
jgi:dihydroneopterin aldolase